MKPTVFKADDSKAMGASAKGLAMLAVLVALLASACSQGRIIKVTPAVEELPFSALREPSWILADSLWEARRDPRAAWASLVAYRAATLQQPRVPELWTRFAHACYFLAIYTEQNQEWSNPERSKGLYLEGARAAETALWLNAAYSDKLTQGNDEAEASRALTGPWLEPAFWLAANRGRWTLGEGRRTRMDGRDRLEGIVRAVAARDGGIYYGGADRFLGVMFVAAPEAQADSARAHFDRADALAPLFFANSTLRAEYLCVLEKDSTGFRTLLENVLRMPVDTLPAAAIENEYEQARARDLLSRRAEFFP